MRYSGQGHEINISIPAGSLGEHSIAEIEKAFLAEYEIRYGRSLEKISMETVTWRVLVQGPDPNVNLQLQRTGVQAEPFKGERPVYFPHLGTVPISTPVYDRYLLKPGQEFSGPAIIEERESTTVMGPNSTGKVDELGNLIIDLH